MRTNAGIWPIARSPMFRDVLCVYKEVSDHGEGRHISHSDMTSVVFDVLRPLQPSRLNTFRRSILSLYACCLRFIPCVTVGNARLATGLRARDYPDRTLTS